MDSIVFRPVQRRKLLLWGWGSALVVLIGAVLAPHVPGESTGFLILPGLVGLTLCPLTLNIGYGHTVLSEEGVRTRTLFRRHGCGWPEVAVIESKTTHGGRGTSNTRVLIQLTSGRSFTLAAPFDSNNGRDPEFPAKVSRIQGYWHSRSAQPGR